MNRRSFLKSILAAGAAPAICKADWLMRASGVLVPQEAKIITADVTVDVLLHQEAKRIVMLGWIWTDPRTGRTYEVSVDPRWDENSVTVGEFAVQTYRPQRSVDGTRILGYKPEAWLVDKPIGKA